MPAPLERLDQARRVQQTGDLRQAETLLRALLKDNPGYPDAWVLLSNIMQGQGRHDEAIQGLGKAATLAPQEAAHLENVNPMGIMDPGHNLELSQLRTDIEAFLVPFRLGHGVLRDRYDILCASITAFGEACNDSEFIPKDAASGFIDFLAVIDSIQSHLCLHNIMELTLIN